MEFKGTKGKWDVGEIDPTRVWSDDPKTCIAWSTNEAQNRDFYIDKGLEEMKYNAKLISKAPEMLEMLKELLIDVEEINIPSSMNDTVSRLKKLIEEATKID